MTFVYREVRALRAHGIEVHTFATWKPDVTTLSQEARDLVDSTFYIYPLNWLGFVFSHVRCLMTRPRRYLSTLWFCLTRPQPQARRRLRTFFHFCQAVHLAREVERQGIQHLHAHFALNATTIAMVVSRLLDTTYSFTAHANDLFVNPILLEEKISGARFIVAISDYNVHFMHHLVPTDQVLHKIHLVHCGIDVEQFSAATVGPRAGAQGGQNTSEKTVPVILSVGRLVEKKGHAYLIQACQILAKKGYSFRCVIVGGGPEEDRLRQLIENGQSTSEGNTKQGLVDIKRRATNPAHTGSPDTDRCATGRRPQIELVGPVFQEDLAEYLAQADIFCLPCVVASDGDMDGIPNTLMEAMAVEVPAVSTTVSGIPELIEDGKTGVLVPPQNAQALAEALARLLNAPELRTALGKAGRTKVIEEFELTKNVNRLVEVFAAHG